MRIGLCTGCFDVLHIGHIRLFKYASEISDKVIVGINSDVSIKQIKGKNRPINNQDIRAEFLLSLKYVSEVIIFDELTPKILIGNLKPTFFIKGGDRTIEVLKEDCKFSPDTEIIRVDYISEFSTTNILKKINKNE
jgi:rfaE bifunctional protein nucleotidyltransferase chain/domain